MRITDEFKTIKEKCTLRVHLEPYYSKFVTPTDIIDFNTVEEKYSQRLFFNATYDTIVRDTYQEEIQFLDKNDSYIYEKVKSTKLIIEDTVCISVYENSVLIQNITC